MTEVAASASAALHNKFSIKSPSTQVAQERGTPSNGVRWPFGPRHEFWVRIYRKRNFGSLAIGECGRITVGREKLLLSCAYHREELLALWLSRLTIRVKVVLVERRRGLRKSRHF